MSATDAESTRLLTESPTVSATQEAPLLDPGPASAPLGIAPLRWAADTEDFFEEPFLSSAEVADVLRQLWAMREGWRTLSESYNIHTLGYASYLDAMTDETRKFYYQGCLSINPILQQRLGWLYSRLCTRLEAILGAPVCFRQGCAIPGFHIFLGGDYPTTREPSIHVDRQYENLHWSDTEEADFNRTISFTLPVQLPASGAGLNTWRNEAARDAPQNGQESWKIAAREDYMVRYADMPHVLHEYSEGTLVVHSGNTVHQMVVGDRSPGNNRITLQGHGVLCDGVWQLFW